MRSAFILGSPGGEAWGLLTGLDQLMREWLGYLSSPFADRFFSQVTKLGSPSTFFILATLFSIFLVARRKRLETLFMDTGLIISWGIMDFLKELVARPRPGGEHLTYATGYSFPSGHAMISTVFYGFLAYLALRLLPGRMGKVLAVILGILIFLIGISRIYLNVHYFSDVVAGFLLGGLLLFLFIKLLHRVRVLLKP